MARSQRRTHSIAETSGHISLERDSSQAQIIASRDFSERLTSERKRIDLKGAEMGRLCGVNANTQSTYENGRRLPDADYLMRASELGVDVLYVLTGRREADLVDDQLGRIVTLWPGLPVAARKSLADMLEALTGD